MIETQFVEFGHMVVDLKSILKEKHITPYQLSKMTNIKEDTIYRYYNNNLYRVDLSNLARICSALNCNSGDIIKYVKK